MAQKPRRINSRKDGHAELLIGELVECLDLNEMFAGPPEEDAVSTALDLLESSFLPDEPDRRLGAIPLGRG